MARLTTRASIWVLFAAGLLLSVAGYEGSILVDRPASTVKPSVKGIDVPRKILFVGNSLTYYNGGVDRHLEKLAASSLPPVRLQAVSRTAPNQTLRGHYYDDRTHQALSQHGWDVVILQGASYEAVAPNSREEFVLFAGLMDQEIRKVGAKTVLFMTWAYRFRKAMTEPLANTYITTGNNLGTLVVPVGLAWMRAASQKYPLSLYSDSKHPSMQGTYLAACVFFSSLTGKSPVGLSYTAGLDSEEAQVLQRIAWETVESFYRE